MNDRQLIADLLSALEYHTEQTRPIEFSRVAIQAAREHLRKPAREWVGLTDDEIHTCWNDTICTSYYSREDIYRALEAKLKEKNER